MKLEILTIIFYIILGLWYVGTFCLIGYIYYRNQIPHTLQFNETYYQELPSDLDPIELSVLLYRKVEPHVFTTTLLSLIKKGAVELRCSNGDYHFKLIEVAGRIRLSRAESVTMEFLENIGKNNRFTLKELETYCGTKKGDTDFLFMIDVWKNVSIREAEKKHFFEKREGYAFVKIMRNLGILLLITNFIGGYHLVLGYTTIILILLLPFFFSSFSKRTKHYNEEYMKWMAFSNYLDHLDEFPKPKDLNQFVKSAIVLKKINVLYEHNPNDKSIHFAYTLYETLNKCYQHAYLNGNRSITSLWNSK